MDKTPIQELIEFMAENLYRGNAIVYGKALELLEKEREVLIKTFDEGRHNGKYVLTNAPMSGSQYYDNTFSKVNAN